MNKETIKETEEKFVKSFLIEAAEMAKEVLFYSDTSKSCLLSFTHKKNNYKITIDITKENKETN